jgi:hypothetical protein
MKFLSKLFAFSAVTLSFCATVAMAEEPPPLGQPAKVTIITEPSNSEVYLGGELLGKSPIENRDVQSGRYTLIVVDQGYELVNKRVNIWPNKENKFTFGTVIPKGHVEITTKPGKCYIYVDGDNADRTDGAPLTVNNLDAGDHLLRAECNNGRSVEQLVKIEGEKTIKVLLDATKGKKH